MSELRQLLSESLQDDAAIRERAAALQAKWQEGSSRANLNRLREYFDQLTYDERGQVVEFKVFSQRLSNELAGFVMTAHPTFALAEKARRRLHAATSGSGVEKDQAYSLRPGRSPTLDEERAQSETAILNIRQAIRAVFHLAVDVAIENYPQDFRRFRPGFFTVATWVGFDLDGRTDIDWSKSLEFRYRLARSGLTELSAVLEETAQTASRLSTELDAEVFELLGTLRDCLDSCMDCFDAGMKALPDGGGDSSAIAALNRLAVDNRERKKSAMKQVDAALDRLIELVESPELLRLAMVFRAEWHAHGLGLSHVHFRLNAVQLHNAIRGEIDLERAPDRSSTRRHYLNEINKLLYAVEPVNVHYGTLAAERTTAKRLFMLAAQFEKYFDGRTPIRLLVAESDTPFTLLTALYYAKLFGVADHVEISPLFETATGLQRGDRVIRELLGNSYFLAYISRQKRFAVQLGFSDSGRYIGQVPANLAIERFKLRLVRLWEERGLTDVQLLFFDTHGESIGRGAHPGSLQDRFATTHTPRVRTAIGQLLAPHKHEVSFQGGDGYLWFASKESALVVLTEFLIARFEGDTEKESNVDSFYSESDWSLDFFLTIREFQHHLANHAGYVALLDSFAPNLMFPTGSRATKRQGGQYGEKRLRSVNQIRAIPHNAMLQQLGYLANVVGGVGPAIALAPDRFEDCLANSARLQGLMSMVEGAATRSCIRTLMAYADLISPAWWLNAADQMTTSAERDAARRLSVILESAFDHAAIGALVRELRIDDAQLQSNYPLTDRPDIQSIHAARIREIQYIYLRAMAVPRFSARTDVSLDDIIIRLLKLEVPAAILELRRIFPATAAADDDDFGEIATYRDSAGGYSREHAEIFDPIVDAYDRILESSAVIALKMGSVG